MSVWSAALDLARMLADADGTVELPGVGRLTMPECDRWVFEADVADRNPVLRRLADGPALALTPESRANLAALPADLPPRPIETGARVQSILVDLAPHFLGDESALPIFAAAVASVSDPPVAHFVRHWYVAAVGLDSRAWTTGGQFPTDRLPLVCGVWTDPGLIRHEVAHTFYDFPGVPRPHDIDWSALNLARVAHHMHGTPAGVAAEDAKTLRERRAWAMARLWALPLPGTTP